MHTKLSPIRKLPISPTDFCSDLQQARLSPAGLAWVASNKSWIPYRHHLALSRKLVDVAAGRCKRLLITAPPRHGKSTLTSHYFPAWYLGTFPDRRIILASYEADFAASWGRKARDVLEEYGPLFGVLLRGDSKAANRWDLIERRGGMMTAGVRGPLTGKGADIFIIDDPTKDAEEARSPTIREKTWDWFKSVAYTRLEPNASIVIITTRWHADDLAGRLLAKAKEDGEEQWEVFNLPAIAGESDMLGRQPGEALWPERFPLSTLRTIERTTEAYWWACLYQQDPAPEGGTEWPKEYFEWPGLWFDEWPTDIQLRVIALDPSKGAGSKFGDYSAFVLLGLHKDGTMYVDADLDQSRDATRIVEDGLELYSRFLPDGFAVEVNGFQQLLQADFNRVSKSRGLVVPTFGIDNRVNKEVRIRRLGPYLHQHSFRFKGDSKGAKLLVQQLRDFPAGAHDDAPDSLEMALRLTIDLFNSRHRPNVRRAIA